MWQIIVRYLWQNIGVLMQQFMGKGMSHQRLACQCADHETPDLPASAHLNTDGAVEPTRSALSDAPDGTKWTRGAYCWAREPQCLTQVTLEVPSTGNPSHALEQLGINIGPRSGMRLS